MKKDALGRNRKANQDVGSKGLPASGDGGLQLRCPDYLAEYGSEAWKRAVKYLRERGHLDSSDHHCVELFAGAYEDYRRSRSDVEINGYVLYEGEQGNAKRNPAVVSMENAWTRCVKLMSEMGFSPTARRKFPDSDGEPDALIEFIKAQN